MEVLLEVEGVKGVGSVRGISILHPDGGARFVVQVDQEVIPPGLADDLGSIEGVNMIGSVDGLIGANTVGVVEEFNG